MDEQLDVFTNWLKTERGVGCLSHLPEFPISSIEELTDQSMQIITNKNFEHGWQNPSLVKEGECSNVVFMDCSFSGDCFSSGVFEAVFVNCRFFREMRFERGLQTSVFFGCTFHSADMSEIPHLNGVWLVSSEIYGLKPPTGSSGIGLYEYIDCTFNTDSIVNGHAPFRFIPPTKGGEYGAHILQTNRGYVLTKPGIGWFFVSDPLTVYAEPNRIATDMFAVSPPDNAACDALFSIGAGANIRWQR